MTPIYSLHNPGVQQILGSELAFAAVLLDGSVVTWGDGDHGGDSSRSASRSAKTEIRVEGLCRDYIEVI